MASLNLVVQIGNLTDQPDLSYTREGTARSTFTVAVNEYRGDEQETNFIPIVCWGKTAENVAEYLDKGSPVAITGRLRISSWEDDDGNRRKYTQVVARNVQFLGRKRSNKEKKEDMPFDA